MDDSVKRFLSENGKKSWQSRKSPEEMKRLKEISKKGVEARRAKTDIGTL